VTHQQASTNRVHIGSNPQWGVVRRCHVNRVDGGGVIGDRGARCVGEGGTVVVPFVENTWEAWKRSFPVVHCAMMGGLRLAMHWPIN